MLFFTVGSLESPVLIVRLKKYPPPSKGAYFQSGSLRSAITFHYILLSRRSHESPSGPFAVSLFFLAFSGALYPSI